MSIGSRRRRVVTRGGLVLAIAAAALTVGTAPPASAVPIIDSPALVQGTYCSAGQNSGTWVQPWFGGEDGTVSYLSDHPRGKMRYCWQKYRFMDDDPSYDYYLINVQSEWTITDGLAYQDAYVFHHINSSVSTPMADIAATDTYTSNKDCMEHLPEVGFSFHGFGVAWQPQICNTYQVVQSSLRSNGATWYSTRAGGLRKMETGLVQKVPQGVVPQYEVNIGVPQYTAVWNGQWWVVDSHLAWTQGWDPGQDAGRAFGPTRFGSLDGGRDEIVSIWPNGDVYAYPNQGWSGETYTGSNNKRVAQGFNKDQTMFGDIDGDGLDEIIAVWPNGEVHAYRNQGWAGTTYTGSNQKLVAQGFAASQTQFGDIDGDGRDEIISIFPNGDVHAYRNQGWAGTTYTGSNQKLVAQGFTDPTRTKFADLNADGRDEIISIFENGDVHAYRNRGWDATNIYDGADEKLVAQGFTRPVATFFGDIDGVGGEEIISIFPNAEVHAYRNRGWNAAKVYDGADQKLVAQGFSS
jgi:hypothetical protein